MLYMTISTDIICQLKEVFVEFIYRKVQRSELLWASVAYSLRYVNDIHWGMSPNHYRRPDPELCRLDKSSHIGTS